jgi:hypothetical protein
MAGISQTVKKYELKEKFHEDIGKKSAKREHIITDAVCFAVGCKIIDISN